MFTKTLLEFPAVVFEDETVIDVDSADFEDEPTLPRQPPPERPTGRPSADGLAALVDASRNDPSWLGEPQWVLDPDSGCLILVAPYLARQTDADGKTYLIECPAGIELDPPATRAQGRAIRTALVNASLKVSQSFWLVPSGGPEIWTPLDGQWRSQIVSAFRDGDAGVRVRG